MDNKISNRQLQALILVSSFGFLSVIVPLGTTMLGGSAGWIFVLVGGLVTSALMAMAVSCKWINSWLFGTKMGNLVSLLLCAKIIFCGGIWLRDFSETIGQFLLPKTSTWIISLFMLTVAFYTACKGVETRGRFAEISFALILIFLIFIFLLSAPNVKTYNLFPLKLQGSTVSILYVISAAFGIEYLLLETQFINDKKSGKSAFVAGIIVYALLAGVVMFTVGVFGVNGVVERRWAVLQIMDTINFPLLFLERQDILMMGFWIASIYVFINGAVFYSGHILGNVSVKKNNDFSMILAAAVLIFIVSIFPQNIIAVSKMIEKAKILNILVEIFILIAFVYGRRSKK